MRILAVVLLVVLWTVSGPAARATERVALVIGNSTYEHVTALANPVNDASDLGAALERIGFKVTVVANADFVAFHRALQSFSIEAAEADMALVYFAGHGIEVENSNYLIPTDAELVNDRRILLETISLDLVTEAVSGARSLRMVLLDACRNNPFLGQMEISSEAGRSIGRGLSPFEPTGGTVVAFAAKGGTIALDGNGRNSPFMRGLLAHIEEPGLDINLMFRKVRDAVLAETNNRQEPFTYGSLPGREVFLVPPVEVAALATPVPVAPPPEPAPLLGTPEEEFAWRMVSTSTNEADLRGFISTFPTGVHIDEAFDLLAGLTSSRATTVPEPATTAALTVPVDSLPEPAASLPEMTAALPEPATQLPESVDPALLVRSIQEELRRAGCNPGPVDGEWGPRSSRALAAFGRDGDVAFASNQPTAQVLELLRSKPGVVCIAAVQQPRKQEPRVVAEPAPEAEPVEEEPVYDHSFLERFGKQPCDQSHTNFVSRHADCDPSRL